LEHHATQAYSLLVKLTPEDPIKRELFDTDVLFHNETHIYTEVIPFVEELLRKRKTNLLGEIFPKCYYVENSSACVGGRDIIVLEDMVPRGFSPSAERLVLDYDHCSVAPRQLARYHAVFYGLKNVEK